MKIAFFEIEDWEIPYIQKKLTGHSLSFTKYPLTMENSTEAKDADIISIFIYSEISREMITQLPALQMVATRSTGYDHIDISACKDKNILVCTVPVYGTHTVAEHTIALLLAISRCLIPSIERTRDGDFSLDGLRGFDLYGKTLGVVGTGNIGLAVIQIAKGLGMNILAYTHTPDDELAGKYGFKFTDMSTLLRSCDVVTLHLPYTKQTHYFINKENIVQFKKGSVLLNTARGGLVETEAILKGLDEGYLHAAGLDVLEEECMVKEERQLLTEQFLKECDIKTQLLNHVLLTRKNVLITPHNAFNSTEALQRIVNTTLENITLYIAHTPQNGVSA